MSKKKIVEGECSVCGNIGRLSFEHIPPRSAFNNKPIQIQNHINLFEKESFLFGKGTCLNKGLGAYSLCSFNWNRASVPVCYEWPKKSIGLNN